ncbi:MAG: hypothetical protein ACT4PG_00710 [Panacagrimonas sp.]
MPELLDRLASATRPLLWLEDSAYTERLRGAFAGDVLVLCLISPRAWVRQAYQLALGADAEVEVGADESDSAAVYGAEFLRSFGESGVDALLLEEDADAEPVSDEELDGYQPVLNVAGHYRCDVGLRLSAAEDCSGEARALQFIIAPRSIAGPVHGLVLGEAFWSGESAAPAPAGGFRFASVPMDAVPEVMLERVSALRQ